MTKTRTVQITRLVLQSEYKSAVEQIRSSCDMLESLVRDARAEPDKPFSPGNSGYNGAALDAARQRAVSIKLALDLLESIEKETE